MTEHALKTEEEPLPTSPESLMTKLDDLDINYTRYDHEAVFTVAESEKLDAEIPGVHCRNLFVRDKKKNMFLVVLPNEVEVDMKKLAPVIDAGRLSFGSADRLWENLGVRPGSVCPFAIINDIDKNVKIVLDKGMMEADIVNYHPLINTMTLGLSPSDLLKFVQDNGHEPLITDLSQASP
ncbi:MAG: prolyl-tRNA synthetase associated domain-containing protein [Pseudomonadota bacterium]